MSRPLFLYGFQSTWNRFRIPCLESRTRSKYQIATIRSVLALLSARYVGDHSGQSLRQKFERGTREFALNPLVPEADPCANPVDLVVITRQVN